MRVRDCQLSISLSPTRRLPYHLSGMKMGKHDGSQHHGVGILPGVYVEKTIAGVWAGRDEFLEKALEIARAE